MSKSQYCILVLMLLLQMVCGLYLMAEDPQVSIQAPENTVVTGSTISDGASEATAVKIADGKPRNKAQLLRIGDNVLYRVLEDRDEPINLTVSDSGELMIPYYGPITVVGKTVEEVMAMAEAALEGTLYEKATVQMSLQRNVAGLSMGTVYLGGRVNNIGAVQVDPTKKSTVAKLILAAGGFADFADGADVRVIRRNAETGDVETIHVDVSAIIEDGHLDKDIEVRDGDFIIVPKRLFNW